MNTNSFDPTKPCRTRDGHKVEILTTKANGHYPIIGNVERIEGYRSWSSEGRTFISAESKTDLTNYEPESWALPEPPHGFEWHRSDGWTEEMLPEGWRPYLKEEEKIVGDRGYTNTVTKAWPIIARMHIDPKFWYITKRPLPAPKPRIVKVPLEPSDITPGSVIRTREWAEDCWTFITEVRIGRIYAPGLSISWNELMSSWLIKRPGSTTWEPSYKLINQPQ